MITRNYPIPEAEAKQTIDRKHGMGAWDRGIRSWRTRGPQPIIAETFIESPKTIGAYKSIPYGNDEIPN